MSAPLSLDSVSVTLGARIALNAVSLDVHAGEIVALLGANGAGKTSLIRVALGLLPASEGRVRLGGADPRTLSGKARALRAAYLPQKPQAVWPITAERLVALGRFAHGGVPHRLGGRDQAAVEAAMAACAIVGLKARRMDEISGGERMRVQLARTIAQGAPLLVLDEPSAGLDPAQTLGVADIMAAHARAGGAVVFSTHDISLAARSASQVVVLREGCVIAQGPPSAALTTQVIEAAYGRAGRIERIGAGLAVVFE